MRSNNLAYEIVRWLPITPISLVASSTIAAEAGVYNRDVELNNGWQYARDASMIVSFRAYLPLPK